MKNNESRSTDCYFDNNANIFEAFPSLEEEIEVQKFSEHMSGVKTEMGKKPSK